jgi:hypothetical protein
VWLVIASFIVYAIFSFYGSYFSTLKQLSP